MLNKNFNEFINNFVEGAIYMAEEEGNGFDFIVELEYFLGEIFSEEVVETLITNKKFLDEIKKILKEEFLERGYEAYIKFKNYPYPEIVIKSVEISE